MTASCSRAPGPAGSTAAVLVGNEGFDGIATFDTQGKNINHVSSVFPSLQQETRMMRFIN